DRDKLAGPDGEAHAPQGVDRGGPFPVDLRQVADLDQGIRRSPAARHRRLRLHPPPPGPGPPPGPWSPPGPRPCPRTCAMMTRSPSWMFPLAISTFWPSERPMTTGTACGRPLPGTHTVTCDPGAPATGTPGVPFPGAADGAPPAASGRYRSAAIGR